MLLVALAACGGNLAPAGQSVGAGKGATPASVGNSNATVSVGGCNSEINNFTANVWLTSMGVDCLACHVRHGLAPQSGARFVLAHPSEDNYLQTNIAAMRAMAAIDANGMPLLLAKATQSVPHGGGKRFAVGSANATAITQFLNTADFASGCQLSVTQEKLASVQQLSDADTLRKAALQIAGRLPTANELQLVSQGDLDAALSSLFAAPGFGQYVLRVFDDTFLNVGNNVNNVGIDTFSYNDYIAPDYCASAPLSQGQPVYRGCQVYWYANNAPSNVPGIDDHDTTQRALSEVGLQLVKYLATTGHDYRDILNANYMLLNPWSARSLSNDFSYNLLTQTHWKNINDPNDYEPVVMNKPNWPTVGLLTDNGFMDTFSTTVTNRNRKRAHFVYQYFLGLDVLTLSQRPANLNQLLATAAADPNLAPPFMSNTLCTDCHSLIDPMAGAWAGYNDNIDFTPLTDNPNGPYGPYAMFPAGFEGTPEPASEKAHGPRWLAAQITADPRFARSQVIWWFTILTSQQPLGDPPATTTDINAYLAAQQYQAALFTSIASDFAASGYNIQVVIKDIVRSTYYRSTDLAPGLTSSDTTMLDTMVGYRWTGPDALNNKLLATTGTTWLSNNSQWNGWGSLNQPLVREYEGLLGGIDPMAAVTQRNESATGLMVRITTTMASQVACGVVAQDFNKPAASRTLFSGIDPSVVPDTGAHQQAIQTTIATIYQQVTGAHPQDVTANLADAYSLFTATVAAGKAASDQTLDRQCQSGSVTQDPTYTLKAWIAVMTYIFSDPRLVQE